MSSNKTYKCIPSHPMWSLIFLFASEVTALEGKLGRRFHLGLTNNDGS